jgi:hypothetical protein
MSDSLVKSISAVRWLPLYEGDRTTPAVLQLTMDTVAGSDLRVSLTGQAAFQLSAMLLETLQSQGFR